MRWRSTPFWLFFACNFIARFGMAITGIFFYYVFVYRKCFHQSGQRLSVDAASHDFREGFFAVCPVDHRNMEIVCPFNPCAVP